MKRIFATMVSLLMLAGAFSANAQYAVVNSSNCSLRLKPDYESGMESQCLMGTVLRVKDSNRYWRLVDAPDYKNVWTTELNLAFMTKAEVDAFEAAPKYICTSELTHIWSEPTSMSQRLCDFSMGDKVRKAEGEQVGGWLKVQLADGRHGWVLKYDVQDYDEWKASRNPTAENIIATAMRFVGVPYLWGGMSVKGFDCSGFVKFCYMMNGIELKRNAREQIATGVEVPYDFDQMRPGDLIYYGTHATSKKPMVVTHVAMYIGDAHIIHSSQVVRINSLRPGDPDYYEKETLGVRRMLK